MGREGDLLVTDAQIEVPVLAQHEKDGLIGVTFTQGMHENVRQWVQDLSQQQEIVSTPTRLYLPCYGSMTTVDAGDTIWFDPASPVVDPFTVERA